ncbi:MAG: polysaccharide pyruvyl transferase family protein [Pseudomonadota bacterium]
MAIYYCMDYGIYHETRNFGDDVNPLLLGKLFHPSIIESQKICLMGIGTILSDYHVAKIEHYERKIVFSSGVGIQKIEKKFDDSWDFVCVRGPKSAEFLGLPAEKGISDGAILLADFYPPKPSEQRKGIIFIPHIDTSRKAGESFKKICKKLGLGYLTTDQPSDIIIEAVQTASLVITEAMHGAILADAMRTPWIPVSFFNHDPFKWEDWFLSIEVPYISHQILPHFWNVKKADNMTAIKMPVRLLREALAKKLFERILREKRPLLSSDQVIEMRKRALRERVAFINKTYED